MRTGFDTADIYRVRSHTGKQIIFIAVLLLNILVFVILLKFANILSGMLGYIINYVIGITFISLMILINLSN